MIEYFMCEKIKVSNSLSPCTEHLLNKGKVESPQKRKESMS